MKFSPLLAAAVCSVAVAPFVHASEEKAAEEKRPGMFSRMLHVFHKSDDAAEAKGSQWKRLEPALAIEPLPLKLSENRLMKVTLQLANKGKRFVQLDFPTSQRIEVLIKDAGGKMVEQWSEDQSFSSDPSVVSINPGERLEYTVSVATRDMTAGQKYTVEAFFPNYDQLRVQKTIVPEK